MNEKCSVNDTLSSVNAIINKLNYTIEQSNNKDLRDTCIQYRNVFENLQWNIYEYAKSKQYYIPAAPAGEADLEQVKQSVQNG